MTFDLINCLYVFVLAGFIGFEVIRDIRMEESSDKDYQPRRRGSERQPESAEDHQHDLAGAAARISERLSQTVGVPVVIRDTEGKPVTRRSEPTPFCSAVMKKLSRDSKHEDASVKLSLKAMEWDISSTDEQLVGAGGARGARDDPQGRAAAALVVGEVVPSSEQDAAELDALARRLGLLAEELAAAPVAGIMAVSLLQFAANTLADLCHEGWVILLSAST